MNLVSPLWLGVAGVVAAGVVFAHLFSSTIPPQDVLPTVRFVPESTPLTVMRSRRVTDWLLLVLRVAAVLLFGLALSGAHLARSAPSRIVVVDASRAVGVMQEIVDSALNAAGSDAAFVVFDSTARVATAADVRALTQTNARGSLSAALAAVHRLVGPATNKRDIELVIVSPVVREQVDSAVTPLLDLWAGTLRTVTVSAAYVPPPAYWQIRAAQDDAVRASLAGAPNRRGGEAVRVIRSAPTSLDSMWVFAGGALVVWPEDGASLLRRAVVDSQGAVATDRDVVVAGFARAYQPRPGKPIARWADGEPAATERAVGKGCVREVAIPVDAVGDVALRESFRGFARSFLEPCGGATDFASVHLPDIEQPVGEARERPDPAGTVETGGLPLWLAVFAAMLLGVEQWTRRRPKASA